MTDDMRQEMVRLLPRLRRFAYAITGSAEKGDDLVQATCERALRRAELWQPGTRLDSWMFRIAQNLWRDRLRSEKRANYSDSPPEDLEIPGTDGRQVMDARIALAQVRDAVAKLPEEQRVLVALVCVDGVSYRQAASILDVPIGTVMSRLARARRTLSVQMGEV